MCELSEPKKKAKYEPPPVFALAMLIVDFVGVVRGFRGLMLREEFPANYVFWALPDPCLPRCVLRA